MKLFRPLIIFTGLLIIWQLVVLATGVPRYILPGPVPVLIACFAYWHELYHHLLVTLVEIIGGLGIGTVLGAGCALTMILVPLLQRWMLPVLVISQAIPVFALAPILVLWFGYGMASKIAMAVLIIFFPVTSSFYYGMKRTNRQVLELARIMEGKTLTILTAIVIPSALPAFGSGLRVAAAVAPIGAVVGEWVGSSSGLGFYMLHANARMQTDKMFAALLVLALMSLSIYFIVDRSVAKLVFWEKKK